LKGIEKMIVCAYIALSSLLLKCLFSIIRAWRLMENEPIYSLNVLANLVYMTLGILGIIGIATI
jgi:hypothetical protein